MLNKTLHFALFLECTFRSISYKQLKFGVEEKTYTKSAKSLVMLECEKKEYIMKIQKIIRLHVKEPKNRKYCKDSQLLNKLQYSATLQNYVCFEHY